MKIKAKYIVLGMLAVLCSCSKIDNSVGREITLSCRVNAVDASTKADPVAYNGSVPSIDNPLDALLLLSTESDKFADPENKDANLLPCHTTISYQNGDQTTPSSVSGGYAKYPSGENVANDGIVYCVGLYPNTDRTDSTDAGWYFNSDNSVASHEINGLQDLMVAPRISGSWNNRFQPQNYHHLLTWLKISVCAINMDVARAWGAIESIEIKAPSVVNIPLGSHVDQDGKLQFGSNGISYGGEKSFTIWDNAGEAENSIQLGITSQAVGSIFCAPAAKYDLVIKLENNVTVNTSISLSALNPGTTVDASYAAGKVFVANLYFADLSIVEGVCSLIAWNEQKEDLYPETNKDRN